MLPADFASFTAALAWARRGNARDNCHAHHAWRVQRHGALYRVAVFNRVTGAFSHFAM